MTWADLTWGDLTWVRFYSGPFLFGAEVSRNPLTPHPHHTNIRDGKEMA